MKIVKLIFSFILVLGLTTPVFSENAAIATTVEIEADFDDVMFELESAVIDRGLGIELHSHVGEMLDRTRAETTGTAPVFERADILSFCSAQYSRAAMEANPLYIAYCPYRLFAYKLVGAEKVVVGYQPLVDPNVDGANPALDDVNALLSDIISSLEF